MSKTYELHTTYSIKYTTKNPLPVEDIVTSLRAFEKLLRRTPAFIEKAYDGIEIIDTEVYVSRVESGSLIEDFFIKFVFKNKKNYKDGHKVIAQLLEDNDVVKTLVAVGVGAFLGQGIMSALPDNAPKGNIEAYNSTVITIGAGANISGNDIQSILDRTTDKKTLVKQAVSAVAITKVDPNASIEMSGIKELTIKPNVIAEAPDEYTPPIPSEKIETYENVLVQIFASDKDNPNKWAGVVPNVFVKRVNFILGGDLDPEKLHGKTRLYADIDVVSKFNKSTKKYVPRLVELIRIIDRKK